MTRNAYPSLRGRRLTQASLLAAAALLATLFAGVQPALAESNEARFDGLGAAAVADSEGIPPIPVEGDRLRSLSAELPVSDTCTSEGTDGAQTCVSIAPAETKPVAKGDASIQAIQPIPSWCADNFNGGRLVTRTQDCESMGYIITKSTVRNGVETPVGNANVDVYSYQYTSFSTPVVAHQYGFSVSTVVGDVSGITLSASSRCTGSCTHLQGIVPATPAAVTGWHEAESFTQPPSTTVGSIYYLATGWTLSVNLPGSTTGNVQVPTDQYDLRCDNAAGGSSPTAGCAVYYAPGRVLYSSSNNPTLVAHLVQAIGSGLPGGSQADPLHRTTLTSLISENRRIACGNAPTLPGLSCDEYPFASTYEGAASGGTARSFPGCNFADPSATGPVGYSRCMVAANQNSSAGAILGNTYRQQRILDGDPFYVALT